MGDRYGKDFLIREIAARANFTIGDVRIVWNTFEDIVKEVIQERSELIVGGLFKFSITEIKEHEGYDPYRGIPRHEKTSYKINIRASSGLLQLLKTPSEE